MRAALATLPWVEQDSITADVGTHLATFAVKDASKFNLEQVTEALKEQQFSEVELISGPKPPAPAENARSDKSDAATAKTETAKPAEPKTSRSSLDANTPAIPPAGSGKTKGQP